MQGSPATRLENLQPAIKKRWATFLREKSSVPFGSTARVLAEMLVFMLDDTLARLRTSLSPPDSPVTQKRRDFTPFSKRPAGHQGGLHLLLTYYLSGARALREAMTVGFGSGRLEAIHRFHRLARDEMGVLCDNCRYRGGEGCRLRAKNVMLAGLDSAVGWPTV